MMPAAESVLRKIRAKKENLFYLSFFSRERKQKLKKKGKKRPL